jgi:3-phenylpropionate/trans-cinnamate dioxygenase ferredoxin reductase subunit
MTFVIVGAGLAGAKAAETLRTEGYDGRVALIGAESERPYERPPLSKGLLLGSAERESVYVHAADWYASHDVELRTGTTVDAIDRDRQEVRTADGERLGYDKLLLATGARPRPLPVPGAGHGGVLSLRTLADSDRIAAVATEGAHLVVIGAGWIGLEVAAAARQRGANVTVVESLDLPLQRVLGDEMAEVFAALHRAHGVDLRFRAQVTAIAPDRVELADGTVLDAAAVLVAVGVSPETTLAEQAGLAVDNGVLVDASLRTADPNIYAAGDLANVEHPLLGTRVRVEHWANALNGGPAAARSMLGQPVSYDRLPYFYTDQYDLGMEYSGWARPDQVDRVVVRGDRDKGEFVAFWTREGRVLAGMNVNIWDVQDEIQKLVRAGYRGVAVDVKRLADPMVPLAEVAG